MTHLSDPSDEQAIQFAIMLKAGLPAEHAICYFTDTTDMAEMAMILSKWQRAKSVQRAQRKLQGKDWQDMSLDEMIETGLNQQYANLAYLCYSVNYVTASDRDKAKLDGAIRMLEAKRAGTAGKGDALSRFFDDLNNGRVGVGIAGRSPLKNTSGSGLI